MFVLDYFMGLEMNPVCDGCKSPTLDTDVQSEEHSSMVAYSCKAEMLAAEEETQHTYQKKKAIGAERKEDKLEKEEAAGRHGGEAGGVAK